jgi:hypothetical protein
VRRHYEKSLETTSNGTEFLSNRRTIQIARLLRYKNATEEDMGMLESGIGKRSTELAHIRTFCAARLVTISIGGFFNGSSSLSYPSQTISQSLSSSSAREAKGVALGTDGLAKRRPNFKMPLLAFRDRGGVKDLAGILPSSSMPSAPEGIPAPSLIEETGVVVKRLAGSCSVSQSCYEITMRRQKKACIRI